MIKSPTKFESGQVIYATLTCAHGSFPVRILRRTAKSVWIEPADGRRKHFAVKRCAVRTYNGDEYASAWGSWHISATSTTDNGFDPLTI